jgi:flagellar hook-associated protein 2
MSSIGATSSSTSSTGTGGIGSTSLFGNLTVNTSGSGPLVTTNGLISGINTQQIIQALMTAYEIPQTNIKSQMTSINSNIADYQQISADLTNLQSAADNLSQTQLWNQVAGQSNNTQVATATSAAGAQTGSVSFNVLQLAQAQVLASNSTVSSTSTVVATAPFLLSGTASAEGVTSLSGSGLSLGQHSVSVTSALSGGTAQGSTALGSSVTITSGVNDQVTANVNGTSQTFTIAAGTYTPAQLASALQTASSSGGSPLLQASVNAQGQLQVGTTLLGSGASLQITGGDALSSLGLAAQSAASTGTAGTVSLDGTSTTVNNVNAGSTVTVSNSSGGSMTLGIGSTGLTTGSFTASEISPSGGTLADVVSAINAANAGVNASAVQVSSGSYLLQLSSATTGVGGQVTIDTSGFNSALGGFKTITAAQDAKVQVGGSGGYVVDSASNSLTGLMQGTTINLLSAQAPGSSPVTVTVSPDANAMATAVSSMLSDANTVLSDINKYAGYNQSTGTGGPLMGDANLNGITNQIYSAISQLVSSGNLIGAGSVGVSLTQSGTISFDPTTFVNAYQSDPTGVAQMFSQGGSFTPSSSTYAGTTSLVYAPDTTAAGNYPIVITQSATQATDTGSVSSTGSISANENLSFTQGGQTATYAATAGESLNSIASGLNQQFASSGLSLSASVLTVSGGTQLVVSSANYGSAQSFSATSSATGAGQTGLGGSSGSATFTGQDVAGTINGQAASGQGQMLSIPFSSGTSMAGFAVNVTASGITSSTSLGTFNYSLGIAGALGNLSAAAVDPVTGSVTQTVASLNTTVSSLQAQYNNYTPMIAAEQTLLTQEYSTLEANLSTLNNTSQWLGGQISKLP